MTGPDDVSAHLGLDQLADLLAAEGSAADVEHVATCAGCAGRLDELAQAEAEVVAVLAALPAPRMPDGLVERLQAVLADEPPLAPAAEAPLAAAAAAEGPIASGAGVAAAAADRREGAAPATVTPFPAGRRRRAWLPATAAAALLVAAGTVGGAVLFSDRSTSGDSVASGVAEDTGAALAGLAVSETGRDYTGTDALAAALPDLLDGGAPVAASGGGTDEDAPAAPQAATPFSEDGTQPLATTSETRESRTAADEGLDRLRRPDELASCLAALLPPDDDALRPVALDYAAFGGEPALVVVLPAQDDVTKVDVFVVGAGCTQGDDGTLFFTRLDRP